jgi:shikimate kinase
LFVIGFMGTGKSTVGRLLAARLERRFVDLDERVEAEAQATIPEIFAAEGEAGFRAREAALLGDVLKEGAQVVAVGGGTPCFGDNLDRMLAAGVVIALNATPDEILDRVGDAGSRPLLAKAEDKRAEVERLLKERAVHYARAHLTLSTSGQAPSQLVTRLLGELGC